MNFIDLQNRLFKVFGEKDYDAAKEIIQQATKLFPERLDKTLFWKACLYSTLNESNKAVDALNEGLSKGFWWNPALLLNDPDLKPIHDVAEFKEVIKKCEDIFHNVSHQSKAETFIYGNHEAKRAILILHWRGSNVKDFAPNWLDSELEKENFFIFPQSSQIFSYNSYCWDDETLARKEIEQAYYQLIDKYNGDDKIIAGASQGGKLAIDLCLDDSFAITKFISVIPAIKSLEEYEKLLKSNTLKNISGHIITGDQDYFYDKTVELSKLLMEHGIKCELHVIKGLGHHFPENFINLLKQILNK
ncbi:TPR end-of-group domain-containing protein [Bacillaceae bacterium W0354]